MKPICVPCQQFFRPFKNGAAFIEGQPIGAARPAPGTAEKEKWFPAKLWMGDVWKCDGCQGEIIVGVGNAPISEHFKDDFRTAVATHCPDRWQVNGY